MQSGPITANENRGPGVSRRYADLCRTQAKPLSILAACCALAATSYSERMLTFLHQFPSVYSFLFLTILFALALPARFVFLSILLAVGTLKALGFVNEFKIAAVSLPVTYLDVITVISNPRVVSNALGKGGDLSRISSITVGVFASVIGLCAFYKWKRYCAVDQLDSQPRVGSRFTSWILNIVALLVILFTAQTSLARYGRFAHANLNRPENKLRGELWLPSSQVTLSRQLGVVEYMAF